MIRSFEVEETDFIDFIRKNGYTAQLHWAIPEETLWWRHTLFVFAADADVCRRRADAEFDAAITKGVGAEMQANVRIGEVTVCRLYTPNDESDASCRMIPSDRVKLVARIDPPRAVWVSNRVLWEFLRRMGTSPLNWF